MSTSSPEPQLTQRPRLLVVELWGIGDLALATSFLKEAIKHYDVTLLAKGYAVPLLAASFPQIEIIALQAPWTAFRGKYHLWKWPWMILIKIWLKLLRRQFDAAVSVRNDPRDHLLMWMIGARHRYGFPTKGSGLFLNQPCLHSEKLAHKVIDWMTLASEMNIPVRDDRVWLDHPAYQSQKVDEWIACVKRPLFAIHAGGSSRVRRLPLEYFEGLIQRLRGTFNFTLLLIPDPDGYGTTLAPLADIFIPSLEINELVDLLGRVDLFICNDSGPAHIASCCGTSTIAFFGPAEPALFRPWGKNHLVVARDICEWRPCWDYCKFPEPKCILALKPDEIWPEIKLHIENLPKHRSPEMTVPAAARVVVVVATFHRSDEVARLMASLKESSVPVYAVVIADNASDPATRAVMENAGLTHRYIACPENKGCGGGLRVAEEATLKEFPDVTHIWILDDDVTVEPKTLGLLLDALEEQNAGSACPQVLDEHGRRGWFPGLLDADKFRLLCNQETPAAFLEKCGPDPIPFSWATGVSLLVRKETLLQAGNHRDDFWIRGEDLDFALRLTQFSKGVYVPLAFVKHLRPGADTPKSFAERMKSAAMLQNCALLFSRTEHGRALVRHWPGNVILHLKNSGLSGVFDVMRAFYLGAIRGLAAGAPGGNYFQKKLEAKR